MTGRAGYLIIKMLLYGVMPQGKFVLAFLLLAYLYGFCGLGVFSKEKSFAVA